jgi:hypothetical protein
MHAFGSPSEEHGQQIRNSVGLTRSRGSLNKPDCVHWHLIYGLHGFLLRLIDFIHEGIKIEFLLLSSGFDFFCFFSLLWILSGVLYLNRVYHVFGKGFANLISVYVILDAVNSFIFSQSRVQ